MDRRGFLKSAACAVPLIAMGASSAVASPGRTRYVYSGGMVPLRQSSRPLLSMDVRRTRHGLVAVRIWEPGWSSFKSATRDVIYVVRSGLPKYCLFDVRAGGLRVVGVPRIGVVPSFLHRDYAPGQHPQSQAPSVDIFEVSIVEAVA